MPANKKPGLAVIIGIGKPKGGMPPPPTADHAEPDADDFGGAPDADADDQQQGGKASQDQAGFVPVWSLCGGCKNWDPPTGECSKVEGGPFRPCDGCRNFFEPVGATAGEGPMEGTAYRGTPAETAEPGGGY